MDGYFRGIASVPMHTLPIPVNGFTLVYENGCEKKLTWKDADIAWEGQTACIRARDLMLDGEAASEKDFEKRFVVESQNNFNVTERTFLRSL